MSPPVETLAPCVNHADTPAGYCCDTEGCRKPICGKCTAKTINQYYCSICGGSAKQVTIARTSRPRAHWIVGALAYPFQKGLPAFAFAGLVLALVGFGVKLATPDSHELDGVSAVVRAIVAIVYVLVVVDATARGNVRETGTAVRLARAFVAMLIVVAPGAISLYFLGVPTRLDGLAVLFGVLALTYVPIALAIAVTDVPFGDVANPFRVYAIAWPLVRRFALAIVAVAVLAAVAVQLALATGKSSVATPLVGDLVAVIPALAAVTILAHTIGLVPHIHGQELHWGAAEMFRDAALPKQLAEGQRRPGEVLTTEALTKGAGSGVGGEGATPEERNEARKVADLLKGENAARALRAYEARAWSAGAFDDRQLLALGKAAVRARKPELAMTLFVDGAGRAGRGQAQLLIAQAQLHADCGRAAEARDAYQKVIELFPNSEPAKVAQRALDGTVG